MCRPLSHDSSGPVAGAAAAGAPAPATGAPAVAPAACGKTFVTELVTLRLLAGWAERSPARLVAAQSIVIRLTAAAILKTFSAPRDTREHSQSPIRIVSSFERR